MNTEQLAIHLRRKHGIEDGVTYDPDIHADVPALCFGAPVEDNSMGGSGQHLRPELDLGFIDTGAA